MMNSLKGVATTTKLILQQRGLHATSKSLASYTGKYPITTPPATYEVPLRTPTMDDLMEPYGEWKTAYENERKNANKELAKGVVALTFSLVVFYLSGTTDGLWMPNLDNIMEDTVPFSQLRDYEGRVVARPD